jgi:hypothetical protein
MKIANIGLVIVLGGGSFVATAVAAQHQWKSSASAADALRPRVVQPRAVLGPASGIYCPDMSEGAVGIHDLGWIPAGLNIEINVESYTANEFDPVAAVMVATMGVPGANNIKATTFYDNDSGGGKDVKISFVSPQAGTYVLLVTDNSGTAAGCYRYQASIR